MKDEITNEQGEDIVKEGKGVNQASRLERKGLRQSPAQGECAAQGSRARLDQCQRMRSRGVVVGTGRNWKGEHQYHPCGSLYMAGKKTQ